MMNKNTNMLNMMPLLLIGCLATHRSFASEKRKLVIDQSLISKRRKLEDGEVAVDKPRALIARFDRATVQNDPSDVLNRLATDDNYDAGQEMRERIFKKTKRLATTDNRCDTLQEISEEIFKKTELHMKLLGKELDRLAELYAGITSFDVRAKMADALYNYRVAREFHAQGAFGKALVFCSKVLALKSLERTPDHLMCMEER